MYQLSIYFASQYLHFFLLLFSKILPHRYILDADLFNTEVAIASIKILFTRNYIGGYYVRQENSITLST